MRTTVIGKLFPQTLPVPPQGKTNSKLMCEWAERKREDQHDLRGARTRSVCEFHINWRGSYGGNFALKTKQHGVHFAI